MADTYSQLYVQIVFHVKGNAGLIPKIHREELHKYITGIINNRNQKLYAIFAMPDHIHILISIKPNIAISDLVRDIKTGSTHFINEKKWLKGKFAWQEGFGAFSYSKSSLTNVVNYILNQEEHHKKITFKEEYIQFLKAFDIDYKEKYLFEWIDYSQCAV